ncbi:hypothetical protein [Massilia sp. DJPM01]|uniref:hypothetical protein n=1 Tax=Massilia sp. DJPM01 TaxID=3024404 RepID=UPI0035A2A046
MIALANEAMDAVRREEMRDQPRLVRAAMGTERKASRACARTIPTGAWIRSTRCIACPPTSR